MVIDMEALADEATTEDLPYMDDLGLEALASEARIKALNDELSAEKKVLDRIMTHLIPAMMTEAGVTEFGFDTEDGGRARLSLGTKVVGSLRNAPDEDEAVYYLEDTGFEGAVKTVVSVDFTESEKAAARTLMSDILEATGKHPDMVRSINPGTLAAFARGKLEEDSTWDFERVGLKAFPTSKFTKRS